MLSARTSIRPQRSSPSSPLAVRTQPEQTEGRVLSRMSARHVGTWFQGLRECATIKLMSKKSAKKSTAATPAIAACLNAGIDIQVHQFPHGNDNFGQEAASWLLEHLNVQPERIFKTLVIELSGKRTGLAVAVVPATGRLNLKLAAAALGASKATMADPQQASLATGYIPGGISPLGIRRKLPTVIDETATTSETVFVSGGRRGWDIEIAPSDLISLSDAKLADIAR